MKGRICNKRNVLFITVLLFLTAICFFALDKRSAGAQMEMVEIIGSNNTELPMTYHSFKDNTKYAEEAEATLEYANAVKFTAQSGESKMYDGCTTFPSSVFFKAMPLPSDNKIGSHRLNSDSGTKIDLSYLSYNGLGVTEINTINGADSKVGYGLMLLKTEYDDGETTLRTISTDFFQNSVDKKSLVPFTITFSANAKYTISLFFETKGSGGENHRIDVEFRIINTYSSEGNRNSIIIDNLGAEGGNVPKNGATCNDFKVNFNNLKHMTVNCTRYSNGNPILIKNISDGRKFSGFGCYSFKQKIGPFDLESFSITIDKRTPQATVDNIKNNSSNIITTEGFARILWNAGDTWQWPIACEIYNRDTYNDSNRGTPLWRDLSGDMTVSVPGRYKVVLRFDDSKTTLIGKFQTASFDVDIEEYDKPSVNYNALSNNRFNNIKTKWYELKYKEEINCFYSYDSAFKYAMSIEDKIVLDNDNFKSKYYNLYSEIKKIYDKYSGDHSSRIATIRKNLDDNMILTDIMNNRAAQEIKEKYFDYNDETQRVFDQNSMFDNSYLYLDDKFQFVKKGDWESSTVSYRNCSTGQTGTIPYGVPIFDTKLPNGKYEITESDKYGNQTKYIAYRDKTAPVVKIAQNGGSPIQATAETCVVDYFSISSFVDEYDPWAVLKVNDKYYVGKEIPDAFYDSGTYNISCYDRNKNLTEFTVVVKDRQIKPVITADNGNKQYDVRNGGNYTVYNYSMSLFDANYPDVFYDISVNGKPILYNDFCKTEVGFGVYSVKITDRYSNASVNYGIRIAERELSPALIWDYNELTHITQNARYVVNRFRIDYNDNYIRIDGVSSCEHFISESGTYDLTATDIYNGNELKFTVVVEDRDISVATKVDYNDDVVLTGGESIVVNQFKLNRLTEDQLYYMTVQINGKEYDNSSKMISKPGIYKIDVVNVFSGKHYESIFVIEDRPLELVYRVNNDEWCLNGEATGVLYNFIIDDMPEYLNLYINGKLIKDSDLPKLYSNPGYYEIVVLDKYSAEQIFFSLELAERYMPNIVCDGTNAQPISEREYTVRRFKFVDIPSYIEITVNGNKYTFDDFITEAGVYNIELRDIFSAKSTNITVTVDGEATDVILVYDDNQKQKIVDGNEYDLYRFRINPLTAEKAEYTQITVNGKPYTFGDFITAFGSYEIVIKDIYKNTEERATVRIVERELETDISDENGSIDYSNGARYYLNKFTVNNTADYLLITVNGKFLTNGVAHDFHAFGEYKIVVVDKYNNAKVEFSVIISERAETPDIKINNAKFMPENGRAYNAYKFSITAFEHQEITVNGVAVKSGEYTKSGTYQVHTRDIYSSKESTFKITVKDMIDMPIISVDFGERKDIANGEKLSAYRFKVEYVDGYQNEYLNIYANGKLITASSKYIVASGIYNLRFENKYNGNSTTAQIVVKDRSLYLPLIVDNDTAINATDDIKVLRYKMGDCSALAEYASIHGAMYYDYNSNMGVYEYTLTDNYTNDTLTVRVAVVNVGEYIGFEYNKKIITESMDIAVDYDIMDMVIRVDGRDINSETHRLQLTGNESGTHYYLHISNKYNSDDVYEIYVIVKGDN